MTEAIFSAADIMLPVHCRQEDWSVVACDQFTSQPDYWHRVAASVGDSPSALHCVLPEVYFTGGFDLERQIEKINRTMTHYITAGLLETRKNQYVYLERGLSNGKRRRGLVGKIDLEAYSYATDSCSPVRPTEGTVEDRLPPRIRVREDAPFELPHVMMLLDDPTRTVLEPLATQADTYERAYDFTLMEQGGQLRGWLLSPQAQAKTDAALQALFDAPQAGQQAPIRIAVGDGNHSLATAKACFEALKTRLPESEWRCHPARWALVELVNLHDEGLAFEPIHRIVTGIQPTELLEAMDAVCGGENGECKGQQLSVVTAQGETVWTLSKPSAQLTVGTLQQFLDGYLATHGGTIDYIHGDDVVRKLSKQPDTVGFLLPAIEKSSLFDAVRVDGALPRKTFSMGEARDKRYYLEAREIKLSPT